MPTAIATKLNQLLGLQPKAPAKADAAPKAGAAPSRAMAADQLSLGAIPATPRTWRESGGFVRDDANGDLAIWRVQDMSQTKPHFSAKARFEAACKDGAGADWTCDGYRMQQLKVTAQVGRYLSTEVMNTGTPRGGAAHPWVNKTLETLDMATGKPVSLDTLFPAHSLFDAMMKDSVVKEALAGAKPKNLEELREALAGKKTQDGLFRFPTEGLFDHFSFHHVKGDQVAVRLALEPAAGVSRGTYAQLGLYMAIPKELERHLEWAAGPADSPEVRAGVLWEEYERKGGSPTIRFESTGK
ncbi:MAG: hypothetical protein VKS61_07590 [Candidatus Sericytochromatia bacterium]|nr:hypothetical protein [Candidatus Sericytochromatia bacterium]